MKRIILSLSLLGAALALAGCGGGAATVNVASMSATVDNSQFYASAEAYYRLDTLDSGAQYVSMLGVADNFEALPIAISLAVPVPTSLPATYNLDDAAVFGLVGICEDQALNNRIARTGTITVTSYSATRVSGSFSFIATNAAEETTTVTDGSFDLPRRFQPTPEFPVDDQNYLGASEIPVHSARKAE